MKEICKKNRISQLFIFVACCLLLPISVTAGIIDGDVINDTEGTNRLNEKGIEAALLDGDGSISGTVTNSGSAPIQGITVYAIKQNDLNAWKAAITDGGGVYTIVGLEATDTEYALFFVPRDKPEYASEWFDNQPTGGDITALTLITLTATNPNATGINAQLEDAGSISGKVTYGDGSGVPGARVDAYAIDNPDPLTGGWLGGTTVSQTDGSYTLGGLRTDVAFKVEFYETYINKERGGQTEWYNNRLTRNGADLVYTGMGGDIDAVFDPTDPPTDPTPSSSNFNWLLVIPIIVHNSITP